MLLVNTSTLLSPYQHTLARESSAIAGTTLRGHRATVIFKPAEPNTGRIIHVTHQGKAVGCLPLTWQHAKAGGVGSLVSWTEVSDPLALCTLGVVEHLAAAPVFGGLDNVIISLDYLNVLPLTPSWPGQTRLSLPLLSGTGQEYLTAIQQAGVIPQDARRHVWTVTGEQHFVSADKQCQLTLRPRTSPGWSLEVLNRGGQRGVVSHHAMYHVGPPPPPQSRPGVPKGFTPGNLCGFEHQLNFPPPAVSLGDVATARPPQLHRHGLLAYRAATIGVDGKLWGGRPFDFAVVTNPSTGQPVDDQKPMMDNEQIRHRLFDFTADGFGFGLVPHEPWTTWPQVDADGVHLRHRYGGEIRRWLHQCILKEEIIFRP